MPALMEMERCWVTKGEGRNGTYVIQARVEGTQQCGLPKGVDIKEAQRTSRSQSGGGQGWGVSWKGESHV